MTRAEGSHEKYISYGPYLIRNEIRLNAYIVEDENGDTIGVFNSRQLKLHHEAKLKPAIEINMIKTNEDIVTIPMERDVECENVLSRAEK